MTNLKLAFRTLFRTPFVTVVAVLSLALGIGANAAIYSLFDQLLRRPIPGAREADRLVNLAAPGPKPGATSCSQAGDCTKVFSYPMFRDLERAKTAFASVAAHRGFGANVAFRNQTLSTEGVVVSGSYFQTLGLTPALGRLFTTRDDQNIGGDFLAVLSYAYWETRLGADPGVIGQRIVVNGQSLTIIGVGPKGFNGTVLGESPSVFVPITLQELMWRGWKVFTNRRAYWIYLFARLAPGATMDRAAKAVNAVYTPVISDVEAPLQKGMSATTLAKFRARTITLEDGRRGQSSMHQEVKTPIILLLSITGIVLLIACANIANLLLARGAGRTTEMAVRLSLGATRRQVLAQLLTEAVLLALLGGAVSIVVAQWTLASLVATLPSDATALQLRLHWNVVVFAAVLSLGTGLLFGLFPALQSTRPDLVTTLRAGSGKLAGARSAARFRTTLVTLQIALSMALLVSAGLFVKSLMNVSRVDLGIRTEHVVTFGISPELNGYSGTRSHQFFVQVEDALRAIPGVTDVSAGIVPVLAGSNWGSDVSVQGFKRGPDTDANSRYNVVGGGYLRTLGIPLLSGREFTAADQLGAPKVAIVNQTFAKKFGLGSEAVGKFMSQGGGDTDLSIQIVGLMKDASYSEVKGTIPPVFMLPYRQDSTVGSMAFYVRSAADPAQVLRAIPGVLKRLDPNLPVENLKTLPQQVKENVFMDRMISTLSAAFALLATLLAAVGLYGVLAYSVAQRTREIGVRMALGADRSRVRTMVLRQVGVMTLVGGIIGIAAAIAIGRGAKSLLFEMQGYDPTVIALSALVLTLVALGAGYVPALRASKVDPMQALRYE